MANLVPIGPDVLSQPLNDNFAALNSAKMENTGDTMTGNLSIEKEFPSLVLNDTSAGGTFSAITGYSGRISARLGGNSSVNEVLGIMTDGLLFPGNRRIIFGSGNPNGNVAAQPGSIYLNTSGGASTTIWVKESGTGNTGWVAK